MNKDEIPDQLKSLDERIKDAKRLTEEHDTEPSRPGSMRVGIELGAGICVGTVSGYYLDKFLDTLPVFFIIGFFFGVAAGALNIYKMAARSSNGNSDQNT